MVRLAREGERLEPDNVVYDLYEMYGLFALLRDNEVPAVLRRAALKKTYQDYFLDGVRAQYQVRQLERRLSPQETLGLWRTKSAPHLSQFLRVGRMLMEMVVQARHRGDHKLPLEIGYDLMKVGRRMRLQSPLTDGSWVGTRLEWFAFNYWTERRVGVPFNPAIPAGMANYASVTGHRRVAVEVSNEENIVAKWSSGFRSSFRKLNSIWLTWPSTTPQELIVLKVIEKAGSYLGVAAIFLVPLAALLASWAWYRKARIEDEPRVLGGAFFLGGLTGLIVTAALLGADAAFIWNSRMTANLDKGLAYLDWPGLTWFAWSWIVVLPVSSLVTWPLLLVTRWQKQFKPRRITWKEEMLTVGEGDNFLNTALGYLVPMIGVGTVVLFELGVLGIYCWTRVPEDIVETSGVTALVATTAFTLPFGLRWLTLPRKRLGFSLWIRATSHTIVGYLVTMGICYGLVLLAALPVLADYASQFEALLRYGDVGMIRTLGGF
jgi:hypothetical protein